MGPQVSLAAFLRSVPPPPPPTSEPPEAPSSGSFQKYLDSARSPSQNASAQPPPSDPPPPRDTTPKDSKAVEDPHNSNGAKPRVHQSRQKKTEGTEAKSKTADAATEDAPAPVVTQTVPVVQPTVPDANAAVPVVSFGDEYSQTVPTANAQQLPVVQSVPVVAVTNPSTENLDVFDKSKPVVARAVPVHDANLIPQNIEEQGKPTVDEPVEEAPVAQNSKEALVAHALPDQTSKVVKEPDAATVSGPTPQPIERKGPDQTTTIARSDIPAAPNRPAASLASESAKPISLATDESEQVTGPQGNSIESDDTPETSNQPKLSVPKDTRVQVKAAVTEIKSAGVRTGEGDSAAANVGRFLVQSSDGSSSASVTPTSGTAPAIHSSVSAPSHKLSADAPATPVAATGALAQILGPSTDGVNRIEQAASMLARAGGADRHQATLQLDPPELGQLRIDIRLHDQGMVMRVDTQNAATAKLIESRLPELRDSLAVYGIRVDHSEVVVRSPGSGDAGSHSNSHRSDADLSGQQQSHWASGEQGSNASQEREAWNSQSAPGGSSPELESASIPFVRSNEISEKYVNLVA
jgi:flagellar hook-length control protein FliK